NGGLLHRFHPPDPVLVATISRSGIRSRIRSAAGRSGNGDTTLARLLRTAFRPRMRGFSPDAAYRHQRSQCRTSAPTLATRNRARGALRSLAGRVAPALARRGLGNGSLIPVRTKEFRRVHVFLLTRL